VATTTLPAPEERASVSPFGRIIGVFFSPKATFADIVRKPTWAVPFVLILLFGTVVCFAINQRTNWREFQRQQIEKNSSTASLPEDQKEQRIEMAAKYSPQFAYVFGVGVPAVWMLIVTLVMWGAFNVLGGAGTNFRTSFAITAHAFLTWLVSSVVYVLILYLKPFGTVDLNNPIAANVGAFLPDDAAKWLVSLGTSIDIFSFWTLALLAIGFAATNPRKLKGGKAFSIAFTVWAAYVVVKVGLAFIFS
jgi:hypothetical protein